jgi:ABC-type uncharacterized transport system involved in gliding motility auxiliary subunit
VVFIITALVILGFGVVALFTQDVWLIGVHFAIALALLGFAAATRAGELRDLFKSGSGRRGLRQGSNALVQTAALLGLLVLVAFLAGRYKQQWDWTEARTHTLAASTQTLLDQIPEDKPIEIYAFATNAEAVRLALDQYTFGSPRISYKIFDPRSDPGRVQQFEVKEDGVVLVCSMRCEKSGEQPAGTIVRIGSATEEDLSRAIRSVISEKRKLYFVNGHGEAELADATAKGLSEVQVALANENFETAPLLLANAQEIPEDADGVVIAGPQASFLPRELDLLDAYLKSGGSLLILADPILVTNLEGRLREWKIALGGDVVVDEKPRLFAAPELGLQPMGVEYASHPVTRKLAEGAESSPRPTLFQLARSVEPVDEAAEVVRLVKTGARSIAAADVGGLRESGQVKLDPAKDRAGPVSLAVARSFPLDSGAKDRGINGEGRLVVVGDADFARNGYVAEFFNADFFLNTTSWLVGEEQFATIERGTPRASRVVMSDEQIRAFSYVAIFMLPEGILLLGIVNWWRRRS